LLLGLLLRVIDLPGAEEARTILRSAWGAVGRALIWFIAFAVFAEVQWTGTTRRKCLFIGLVLVLIFGLVSGALLRPAFMQIFGVVAALAMAGWALPDVKLRPHVLIRSLPAETMLIAVIAYFVLVLLPGVRIAETLSQVHRAATEYDRIHSDAE